jgi:hypothetical protein
MPIVFIINGCLFLLISTIFFHPITDALIGIQKQSTIATPGFWDLSIVLKFVKVIFVCVGVFLTCFGIGMFLMKKHWIYPHRK